LLLKQITSRTSTTANNGGSIVGDFTVSNYDKPDIPPVCGSIGKPTVIYVNTKWFADHYPENSVVTARTNTNP